MSCQIASRNIFGEVADLEFIAFKYCFPFQTLKVSEGSKDPFPGLNRVKTYVTKKC